MGPTSKGAVHASVTACTPAGVARRSETAAGGTASTIDIDSVSHDVPVRASLPRAVNQPRPAVPALPGAVRSTTGMPSELVCPITSCEPSPSRSTIEGEGAAMPVRG